MIPFEDEVLDDSNRFTQPAPSIPVMIKIIKAYNKVCLPTEKIDFTCPSFSMACDFSLNYFVNTHLNRHPYTNRVAHILDVCAIPYRLCLNKSAICDPLSFILLTHP